LQNKLLQLRHTVDVTWPTAGSLQ